MPQTSLTVSRVLPVRAGLGARGRYREVVPERRLVFSWSWISDGRAEAATDDVRVDLVPWGTRCRVDLERVLDPRLHESEPLRQGWSETLDQSEGTGPAVLLPVRTDPLDPATAATVRQWGGDPDQGATLLAGLADRFTVVAADYEEHRLADPAPATLTPDAVVQRTSPPRLRRPPPAGPDDVVLAVAEPFLTSALLTGGVA